MTGRAGAGRVAAATIGVLLVIFLGVAASGAAQLTCHEDVGSSDQAPNLCRSVGSGVALWLPMLVGPFAVLLLVFSGARARTLAFAIAVLLAVEGGLLLMWVLVSHGTIHY